MRLRIALNRLRLVALLLLALAAPLSAAEPVILVLGDSLSSGYGIELARNWVNLLQQRLQAQGYPHRVVNASISGDTSQGGRSRLPAALAQYHPDIVILELGGNDGLRGLPLEVVKANLAAMIERARQAGAQVLLAEMRIPPNYGPRYTEKFQALYGELAQQYGIPLIPFLLDGVAAQPGMMQEDGIHPTAAAQMRIVDNVWKVLEPVLENRDSYSSTTNRTRGLTAHSNS